MTEYTIATAADEKDIIDFANYVFSQAHRPHDFKTLLPKVYGQAGFADYHVIAKQEGKVVGLVGVLPFDLKVMNGHILKGGYVGSVSVHPYHRGEGHMKKLMDMAVARSKAMGMDFMALGGQRQRYRYFGFENGGTTLVFWITRNNIQKEFNGRDSTNIAFVQLSNDEALTDAAFRLQQQEIMIGVRRRKEFITILESWEGSGYAVMENGRFAGYLYARDDEVPEWVLYDPGMIGVVLDAWMAARSLSSIRIEAPLHAKQRIAVLEQFAEGYELTGAGMYRILKWQKVLEALLQFKCAMQGDIDGAAVLEVIGEGRFRLQVSGGQASVTLTEESPDISVTNTRAVAQLLSWPAAMTVEHSVLRRWLPLHIHVPAADRF